MSKSVKVLIAVLVIMVLVLGGLLINAIWEKPSNIPATPSVEQATTSPEQAQTPPADNTPFATETSNRECLLAAETFFEGKRASNVDYYSATWTAYFEAKSGMCFVRIASVNGVATFDVASGYQYKLQGNTFVPLR